MVWTPTFLAWQHLCVWATPENKSIRGKGRVHISDLNLYNKKYPTAKSCYINKYVCLYLLDEVIKSCIKGLLVTVWHHFMEHLQVEFNISKCTFQFNDVKLSKYTVEPHLSGPQLSRQVSGNQFTFLTTKWLIHLLRTCSHLENGGLQISEAPL